MEEKGSNEKTARETAFVNLLVASQPRIFGYLVTLSASISDAEEVMQETSLMMWSKFDEFNLPEEITDSTVNEMVAWGNQIAYFKVMNRRRKKNANLAHLSDKVLDAVSQEWKRQDNSRILEIRRSALKECVESLPEKQRSVLESYYWKKNSVAEIAKTSGKSEAGIYKSLQRIRVILHGCISQRLA